MTSLLPNAFASNALRGYLAGLGLSTAGSSATFTVAPGVASDSTNQYFMTLASAISKTTSAWAVGSGNGGLDTGTIANATWYHAYEIMRPDTLVVDALVSQAPGLSSSVTATSASPCVFTWATTPLPFVNGTPVNLSGTTAPTGFTLGTTYFVVGATGASGTFNLAATQGGAAINSSSTGTAVVANAVPVLPTNYTLSRRIGSMLTDGSAHWTKFVQLGDTFLWDTPVTLTAFTLSTTAALKTVGPTGIKTQPFMTLLQTDAGLNTYFSSPDTSDLGAANNVGTIRVAGTSQIPFGASIWTDVAGQIRVRSDGAGAGATTVLNVQGWIDTRGKLL